MVVTVEELLRGKQVVGGYFGNEKPRAFNQRLVREHSSGALDISGLISGRKALEEINVCFEDLKNGKTVRNVIEFQ